MKIIVFTKNPPSERHSELICQFTELGFAPLVDSIHYWKEWFVGQFTPIPHRMYYTQPFLLTGKVTDIDFNISGNPDFAVYDTAGVEISDEEWTKITNWLDSKLFYGGFKDSILEECLLKPEYKPETILSSGEEEYIPDPLVQELDATKHYYTFEMKHFGDVDLMFYSVTKPYVTEPYTVMVDHFSVHGHKHFFTDIYNSDFGGNLDFNFLVKIWDHLEMRGELTGEKLDELIETRTKEFLPIDGECKIEPQVYRTGIDDLLVTKEAYGLKV